MEDAEGDIMKRKPRNAKDGVFAGHMGLDCVVQGLIITALVLASFFVGVYFDMGYIHIADMIAGNADEEGVIWPSSRSTWSRSSTALTCAAVARRCLR